jgi:hypothetical protein
MAKSSLAVLVIVVCLEGTADALADMICAV